jgi:hypothetical protein
MTINLYKAGAATASSDFTRKRNIDNSTVMKRVITAPQYTLSQEV